MTVNPRPAVVVAASLPSPTLPATLEIATLTEQIRTAAGQDAGRAVRDVNAALLEAFFDAGFAPYAFSGWSVPQPQEEGEIIGTVQHGRLFIAGRQQVRKVDDHGGGVLVVIRDPLYGGYIAHLDGDVVHDHGAIFEQEGLRERFIEITTPREVEAFQAIAPEILDGWSRRLSLIENHLHAAVDLGLLHAFGEIAHEHITTRTRPWQGQSLARATDDPHLVRRYGEYRTTLHALERLVADATAAIDAGPDEAAAEAVATARGYATLAGQTIINGTIELLGAGATSGRYGFDRYWSDFTAHAIAHPPHRSLEAIGETFVRTTAGD